MPVALVVDDHAEGRYLVVCVLRALGFSALEAAHGEEALSLARSRPVELIVSDILMPTLDGFGLCRAKQADPALRGIPFVFYTATYTDARDEEFARSLGADDFLRKPMDPRELEDRLRQVLSSRQSQQPPQLVPEQTSETPFLRQYNQVLIRKLEDKLTELEQVNESLLLNQAALTSSAHGIAFLDFTGQITSTNPAMAELLGRESALLVGCDAAELLSAPTGYREWLECPQNHFGFETRVRSEKGRGEPRCLSVAAHVVSSKEGARVAIMLSCQDITEKVHMLEELARAERLQALSLFSAGIAHDFNNLLVAMLAGLDLGASSELSAEEREEYRAAGLAAVARAKELTTRLIAFSRGGATERTVLDLRRLVRDSLRLALSGSGIRSEVDLGEEPAFVEGNAGELGQVFSNLLVNARQAQNDLGKLRVRLCHDQDQLCVTITDDGPGIAPELLSKIFLPFFTTKSSGTGLGLATSVGIVREHQGRIRVDSVPGKGATFEVILPKSNRVPAVEQVASFSQSPPRGGGRILVLDEQLITQALMQRLLERAGYQVVAVSHGEQVLLELERAEKDGRPFSLLILELTVRGGLGGAETLRLVRERGCRLPAIASTGYGDALTTGEQVAQGFARVLTKPFFPHELLGLVKAVLAEPSAMHLAL